MLKRAPTMNDVAERAGVSRVTASVVLNNTESNIRVSATTRERVQTAAMELHYQPNAVARSLQNRTTNLIGVYNNGGWIDLKHPFFSELINGLYKGCYANRKSLLLHTPPMHTDPVTAYKGFIATPIDGLIIKTAPDDPLLPYLYESYLPVVAIVDALPPLPSVVSDDISGATDIFNYLWLQGHRRFFYQHSQISHTSVMRRCTTFREHVEAYGGHIATDSVPDGEAIGFSTGLQQAMKEKNRPTAVLCWNDRDARSVIAAAESSGLRVPEDLAVVGYDDGSSPLLSDGRHLTTVRVDWEQVAELAITLLVARIAGNVLPPESLLSAKFIVGDTA